MPQNIVRILHISDIHRAPNSTTSNTTLLGKLMDDIETTYQEDNNKLQADEPHLGNPDVIVVSGDLTQRADDAEFELAAKFLENLLPLVNNERKRIVIVPGNHDISWKIASESYSQTTEEAYKTQTVSYEPYNQPVKKSLNNTYWQKNESTYTDRFKPYKNFFDKFYQGEYNYSLNRDDMYTVYDLSEILGLVIVGYNSCDEIDAYTDSNKPYSLDRRGIINTDAIYKAKLSPAFHSSKRDLLRIGVFHHNIRSVDYGEDFLEPKYLQILKRHGLDFCLHGHVHRANHDIFDPEKSIIMPVVGAGSLAAPYQDRPSSTPMGYNLIVVNKDSNGIWAHTRRHDENHLVWAADYQWNGKPYFIIRSPTQDPRNPESYTSHISEKDETNEAAEDIGSDPESQEEDNNLNSLRTSYKSSIGENLGQSWKDTTLFSFSTVVF